MEERRKLTRISAPKVSIAAVADNTMSAAIGRKVLFGRVRDINSEAICASLDIDLPSGKEFDLILRLFKMDLQFRGKIIRSDKAGDIVFVAFKFDWDKTADVNKDYLQQYLDAA